VLLYRTLGPRLDVDVREGAVLLGLAMQFAMNKGPSLARAGFGGPPLQAGIHLFEAMLARESGLVFAVDEWEDMEARAGVEGGKIQLHLPDLLAEVDRLDEEPTRPSDDFHWVLSAGERRSYTANTILRDPDWRKKDASGPLRMSVADAARLNLGTGDRVRLSTKRGSVTVQVEISPSMQDGHVSLPNGLGVSYGGKGESCQAGVAPNELTASEDRDPFAGTPWHKYVPAAIELLEE
jgi:anaerobic selenocysteine-containing dehydrogenase